MCYKNDDDAHTSNELRDLDCLLVLGREKERTGHGFNTCCLTHSTKSEWNKSMFCSKPVGKL